MAPAFVRNAKLMMIVLAATVGLAGCDAFTGPVEVHVRTSATEFPPSGSVGQQSVAITGTIVNDDAKSVWLSYCGAAVQKRVAGSWVTVWQENCAAVDGVATEIKSKEAVMFRIDLSERAGPISYRPAFEFDICNTHRVVLPLTDDGEYTSKTRAVIAPSNSFGFGAICNQGNISA